MNTSTSESSKPISTQHMLEAPIVAELKEAGYKITSVSNFLRWRGLPNYLSAIPILLRWLELVDYDPLLDTLLRTLTVTWAGEDAQRAMLKHLGEQYSPNVRWAAANALRIAADDSIADELFSAIQHKDKHIMPMLALACGRLTDMRTQKMLIQLLQDDNFQVVHNAIVSIGERGDKELLPYVEPLLQHPNKHVRKKAEQIIRRLGQVKASE